MILKDEHSQWNVANITNCTKPHPRSSKENPKSRFKNILPSLRKSFNTIDFIRTAPF